MTDSPQPEVREGQRWREVDPRFEPARIVEVLHVYPSKKGSGSIVILATIKDGKMSTRTTEAKIERFNGKRGGYSYHAEDQVTQ